MIAIGSDHGGFDMKELIVEHLKSAGYDVNDFGCYDKSSVDYPDIADKGNIRDYTDLLHLVILNNLENINAELIKMKISQI